jgi:hypothetical protein
MKRLNPEKLTVEYRGGISPDWPIIPRLYTLTHSDETGELFLTVGREYAYDMITSMRDEVLGKWIPYGADHIALFTSVYVDGTNGKDDAIRRNWFFVKEMPLALEAIRYGDRKLFYRFPLLDSYPIFIRFYSKYTELDRLEYWGTLSHYR